MRPPIAVTPIAEGGARAPEYAILSGTGGNAATITGTGGSYTVTKGTGDNAVTWGTITLNTATGAWTFTANAASLTALHDGEEEVLSLQAEVTDEAGAKDTQTFTITLTGANEDPEINVGTGTPATQASVLFHGVRFTAVEPGTDANTWDIGILDGDSFPSGVFRNRNEAGGFDFDIQFTGSNTEITSDEIIAVWNAHASDAWKAQITLTREGALQTDTLDNLAALDDVPLTGGRMLLILTMRSMMSPIPPATRRRRQATSVSLIPIAARPKAVPARPPMPSSPARALMPRQSLRLQAPRLI